MMVNFVDCEVRRLFHIPSSWMSEVARLDRDLAKRK